eukprot:TRINITY_DN6220_c0_g1_i1.p1 TRINITY_DN6220_c0_g1~~TRINITY_DN6220_c0_g1_i1.p1  ORF type:complete len:346 (+),score=50.37 TRINITY_DN6220_c0_g1_i1:46-1083(+)
MECLSETRQQPRRLQLKSHHEVAPMMQTKRPKREDSNSTTTNMGPPRPFKPEEDGIPMAVDINQTPMFGKVYDDETAAIMAMVSDHCRTPGVEIEARIGVIVEKKSRARHRSGTSKSSCIVSSPQLGFEPSVSSESFYKVNQELNLVAEKYAPSRRSSYLKSKTIDLFHTVHGRVTVDSSKEKVLENISKQVLQTIDIHCPKKAYDIRFRSSIEQQRDSIPIEVVKDPQFLDELTFIREKERRSYKIDCFRIDLTTANEYAAPTGGFTSLDLDTLNKKETKLEIEIELDLPMFCNERKRTAAGHSDAVETFAALCKLFIDNTRGIADCASAVRNPSHPIGHCLPS